MSVFVELLKSLTPGHLLMKEAGHYYNITLRQI